MTLSWLDYQRKALTLAVMMCWRCRVGLPGSGQLFSCLAELLCVSRWQSAADHAGSATRLGLNLHWEMQSPWLASENTRLRLNQDWGQVLGSGWFPSKYFFPKQSSLTRTNLKVQKKHFHKQHDILQNENINKSCSNSTTWTTLELHITCHFKGA